MSDCALVKKKLKLVCPCCDSCHEDHDEHGYDLCEISIKGDSYWVCCFVQRAAFAPQETNMHTPELTP